MSTYPKFKELKMNERTATVCLLQAVNEAETKSGKPYCRLTLSDGESVITANIWDRKKEEIRIPEKSLVGVEMYPKPYNDTISYEVYKYMPAPSDAQIEDFVIHAPYKGEDMYEDILKVVSSACDSPLSDLVKGIYEENKEKLLYWSAAKAVHHACYGGLLYHTMRMVRAALVLCRVYTGIKKDVLLAGVALHDIGKLVELDTDSLGVADYSVDGTLFNHAYLGMRMVEQKAAVLGTPEELTRQVLHIIASHHGQLEWGAMCLPATPEASLVHEIDMIDSRQYQYEEQLKDLAPGELSERVFGLGAKVYRPLEERGE